MAKVLEVHELAKSFGGVQAVKNLSFDLSEGELLAMIGPNGAGKSTCFNLINGQLRPDYGSVVILGKKINGYPPRQVWKLGVGRTFQITSTFASMTVLENIKMVILSYHRRTKSLFSRVRKLYNDESMELLKLVGIEDQHDRVELVADGEDIDDVTSFDVQRIFHSCRFWQLTLLHITKSDFAAITDLWHQSAV